MRHFSAQTAQPSLQACHPNKPVSPLHTASPYRLLPSFISFFCMLWHAKTWLRLRGLDTAEKWCIRMWLAQGAREDANLVIAPTAATAAPDTLSCIRSDDLRKIIKMLRICKMHAMSAF
jgi:hypothetical protein